MTASKAQKTSAALQFEFDVDQQSFADHCASNGAATLIKYSYTDAVGEDYEKGKVYIDGVVDMSVLAHLSANLFGGTGFLPHQLGMPKLQDYTGDDEFDHEMHNIEKVACVPSIKDQKTPRVSLDFFTNQVKKLTHSESWDIAEALEQYYRCL